MLSDSKPRPATPKLQILKWLTIGFLGSIALFLLAIGVVIWKFTPFIDVKETNGRATVRILGGLISVDGESDSDSSADSSVTATVHSRAMSASQTIDPAVITGIAVTFASGNLKLSSSESNELRWGCEVASGDSPAPTEHGNTIEFDWSQSAFADCEMTIPTGVHTFVTGESGEITVDKVKYPVTLGLANGHIRVAPAQGVEYRYQIEVTNGKVDKFESSSTDKAIPIAIQVGNGAVQKM